MKRDDIYKPLLDDDDDQKADIDDGVSLATKDDDGVTMAADDGDDGGVTTDGEQTCQTPKFHHSYIPRRCVLFHFFCMSFLILAIFTLNLKKIC